MPRYKTRQEQRWRRHRRVRKRIFGTPDRPRIVVYRSLRHIYVQAIDDLHGRTLTTASTLEKDLRTQYRNATVQAAQQIGERLASRLAELGIRRAVFDRGGFKYHGQVRAVCESLREHGIEI